MEENPPWLLGQLDKLISISSIFLPGVKFSFFPGIILNFGRFALIDGSSTI